MTTRGHGLTLMRIFWPSDAPKDVIPGVLVGWRNSENDILVIGVLQGVEARNVEQAVRSRALFKGSLHPLEKILERCGNQVPQVLGTFNGSIRALHVDYKSLAMHSGKANGLPRIDCMEHCGVTAQIIVYDRPNPLRMQYMSLTPISLTLGDKHHAYESVPPFDSIDRDEEAQHKQKQKLVEKLKLHTVVHHPRSTKELALPIIINQVNCSAELNVLMQSNIGLVGVRIKRSMSVSERVVESAVQLQDSLLVWLQARFMHHVWPAMSQVLILCLMAYRLIAEGLIRLLDWRPIPDAAALKDISATAQQIDIRLQQFCYWPAQYVTLHSRSSNWESMSDSQPEYIRFFNSLWLVANDVIIGIALGLYIFDNADLVSTQVTRIMHDYAVEGLQRMILWLMDWPAGLKLNNELAKFLGDLFLWVIDYWAGLLSQVQPALPLVIRIIGIASFAGASMPISLFSDLVSLLTLHIYSFYIASARIYNWQLTVIISLFHLFRGKKRNVLRNRIDSCDYDLDQLLLGTILFTLLFFLLPTVAVFYATFAGARMAIIALKAALDTWLACLNHFPLFALMLRFKDSRRLPGGIRFELCDVATESGARDAAATSYLKLQSVPLPLTQTFSQYAHLTHRLRKHYLSPRVFLCLVSGQFVPPIHRKNLYSLQYSMLPAERVSVGEMWRLLTGKESGPSEEVKLNGHAVHSNGRPVRGKPGGKPRVTSGEKAYWWSK